MQNLPLEQVEVLGAFDSSGLQVPVCNGARTHTHVCTSKNLCVLMEMCTEPRGAHWHIRMHRACMPRWHRHDCLRPLLETLTCTGMHCVRRVCRRTGTDVGCLSSPGAVPKYVNATIANLHFHTYSEHVIDGERSRHDHRLTPLDTPPHCRPTDDRPEPSHSGMQVHAG